MDLVPKSYLVLAGFYRGKDEDLELITLTNEKDKFMALRDQLTLYVYIKFMFFNMNIRR
jgi:hypothetical protein